MFNIILKKLAASLNKKQVPYMVIGGQAVLLYGEPRLTKDIDITLGLGIEGLEKVMQIVEKISLRILVDNPEQFVKKTMVLPVIDDKTGIRVDFIFSYSQYEKQAITRAVEVKFGRTGVKFATLEDVIIHKIIAGRARDIEDIKAILLKNPYDGNYIREWLKKFDIAMNGNFSILFQKIEREINE
ncbi:MAG: nucleotidyl transferase AbiEii/AbiGii toxin family protein [Candidatus Omnitrophica bacterium]|nr:nucleotidyl transferase AbiEii/AbiGii toxin family protein [Candidatus Omnitrophota bacterium]